MKYPKYPAYTADKNAWGDEYPTHWQLNRLRFACIINPTKSEIADLPTSTEVSFVPMEAVGEYGGIQLETTKPIGEVLQGYTYFKDGDVVIAKITPCFENGKGALAENLVAGVAFGTTELHVLRPRSDRVDPKFLFYVSISTPFRKLGEGEMYGAGGQKRVPNAFVENFKQLFPPLKEQRILAAFLDQETAQIDTLIARQERLIALLQEKRQALISHAVTKGLSPDAPMKDSGVEWLGEVPAHWEVTRLRFACVINPTKSEIAALPPSTEVSFVPMEAVGEYGGIRLETTKPIGEVLQGYTYFKDGDVILAKITPCFENGKGALAKNLIAGIAFGTTELHVLRPRIESTDPQFLFYVSISTPFRKLGEGEMYGAGGQKRVPNAFVENFKQPLPPLEEQTSIAAFLDTETAKIDTLTEKAKAAIERLQERRTALISAAVTGKIDVRA